MRIFLIGIACVLICIWVGSVYAQQPPDPTSKLPAGITVSDSSYPFPPEDKAKVRDLQFESDQLEIQNQKLLLQIEQNKARQAQLLDQEKSVAFNFATRQKINLDLYDMDSVQVRFIKKQPKK